MSVVIRMWTPVLACLAVSTAAAASEPYAVGDRLDPFTLEDQFGETRSVDASVAIVLFSRDMDGGDLLKSALADAPEGFLAEAKAAYVADISGMPGLIARLFAIPSMRDRGYPMLLDRDGETTARLPDVEGQATLLFLQALRIERVAHLDSADAVRRELGLPEPDGDAAD